MNVLGIETSCDETAAAVLTDGRIARSNVVASQISLHAGYGGVVPELAAREHLRAIDPVVSAALHQAGMGVADIDAVAVTNGPGLVPALLVGVAYAKGLSVATGLPLVGINHFIAHIYGGLLESQETMQTPAAYPVLALVVSGGHTSLALIDDQGHARIVGTTLDDAAGEAFDKAAKILDLGYPGGPVIDRLATTGDPTAYDLPRPLMGRTGRRVRAEDRLNFSFSGVKTALMYTVKDRDIRQDELPDLVASYQAAVVDVLVSKTIAAAEEFGAATIVLCGGVACNSELRRRMEGAFGNHDGRLAIAPPRYCTDNAAMVAGLAYHYLVHHEVSSLSLGVTARLPADLGSIPFAPGRG